MSATKPAIRSRQYLHGVLVAVAVLFFEACSMQGSHYETAADFDWVQYEFTVDSISIPSPRRNKFIVQSGMPGIDMSDLKMREFARYVERALLQRGCGLANNIRGADLVVEINYGVTDKKQEESTTSTSDGLSVNSGAATTVVAYTSYIDPSVSRSRSRSHSSTTVRNLLTRTIILKALDASDIRKRAKSPKHIWETSISGVGEGQDWRTVFPVMLAVAMDYIGSDTGGQKQIEVLHSELQAFHEKLNTIKGIPRPAGNLSAQGRRKENLKPSPQLSRVQASDN